MSINIDALDISSPKRSQKHSSGWEGFFPYYAGYPEIFADRILRSANLTQSSHVLDPWNGSGTTTYAASRLGIPSIGIDLNPVMAVVARARALPASEHDSLLPLGREIVSRAKCTRAEVLLNDPLGHWFGPKTASWLRHVEFASRELLLGDQTKVGGANFNAISAMASTFYVALFSVCRHVARQYKTSNPTWIRYPKKGERRAYYTEVGLESLFLSTLGEMASALKLKTYSAQERGAISLHVADSTEPMGLDGRIDFVLTSPPYCTRLDYTAATRLQLAVLWPLMDLSPSELSRRMTGSIRVPPERIFEREEWGGGCIEFLKKVSAHPSKASSGYYHQTHADYYSKLYNSLGSVSSALRKGGAALMVVQDSYYKDIHNDLPLILTEMADSHGLRLRRRENFPLRFILARKHPHTRSYRSVIDGNEAVLCFQKT